MTCQICGAIEPAHYDWCAALKTVPLQSDKAAILALTRRLEVLEADNAALLLILERCRTVLGNMALENEGAIFNRWPISHEPLRNDARNLLPSIDEALK